MNSFVKMRSIGQITHIVRNVIRNILFSIAVFALFSCAPPSRNISSFAFALEVHNPLDVSRKDILIRLPEHMLGEMVPSFDTSTPGIRVVSNEAEISSEYADREIRIVIDNMKANETKKLNIFYVTEPPLYRKRTQAELSHKTGGVWKDGKYIGGTFMNVDALRVPPEHRDHSDFIRYEGPGWESEKVGYRLYLDQRNAIDVFGKKTNDLVLMGVGTEGSPSYHEMQPWGMDIMKVGNSLGLGSIGIWTDSVMRVEKTDSVSCDVRNGQLASSVGLMYYGWKTPSDTILLSSWLMIQAGSRWTLSSNKALGDNKDLCTGVIKDEKAKVFKSEGNDSTYGYIATYGKQSLNNDNLGLAILFAHNTFVDFKEDQNNHVVRLKENDTFETVDYYLGAAWELEPNGITNEKDFLEWVNRSARELANPVTISVK